MSIETSASCWHYVGEGNQNLVLRYHGNDPFLQGKVLRVYKNKDAEAKGPDELAIVFQQQFIETVMQPLLGSDYVATVVPVKTGRIFLEQITSRIEPYRPTKRLEKQIALNTSFSLLMDDLMMSTSSTLVFELKPKWGFKPKFGHPKKQAYCRYCMHSHLRQQMTYGYCPLDLYSDDPIRIGRALKILFETPIEKTLKATIEGKLVPLTPDLCLKDVRLPSLLTAIFSQDPILSHLKQLQLQLDSLDVEGVWPLFEKYRPCSSNDIHLWKHVVERFLNQPPCSEESKEIQKIHEYVLSMTLKDCSLMISVGPFTDKKQKWIKVGHQLFNYRITVIDIDLKNIQKIPYWYQLDQNIVQYAIETDYQKSTACQE
ncbi:inositol-pentakisphosphate 2-kinase [Blakeslea trispora]|nr:inositol-pentakisphosphate 2-kinase [Blakeslea trispora]